MKRRRKGFTLAEVVGRVQQFSLNTTLNFLAKYLSCWMEIVQHDLLAEEVLQDKEGLQTMRNIAHNMAWILKCLELGKQNGLEKPKFETGEKTNFIR